MPRESLSTRSETLKEPVLAVSRGGQREIDYPIALGRPLTIGSAQDNTIVIDGVNVAPRQAVVQIVSGQIILEDQQTPGGTIVNGQPVATCMLGHGDVIQAGTARITVVDRTITPAKEEPAEPGQAAKYIKLGAVGLVTAGVMIFILRLMAPAPPPSEDAGQSSGAAQGAAPAAGSGSNVPAVSEASKAGAAATAALKASPIAPMTDTPLVRQVATNAAKSGVDPVDALFDEGESQLAAGRLRDASRLFAAVMERRPSHPLAAIRLNETRQRLDQSITDTIAEADRSTAQLEYDDAVVLWERVLELVEPGDPRAARARQGIDEARRHLRR